MHKHIDEKTGIAYWLHAVSPKTPPLIMIHGHGGDHRGLVSLAEQLKVTSYAIDLPGFGASPPIALHTMQTFAGAVRELADSLGLTEFAVLGHSLGAAVALELAVEDQRVSKLVLVNPIPSYNKLMKQVLKLVGNVSQKIPEPYAERLVHAHLYNLATFLVNSRQRRDREHMLAYLKHQADTEYSLRAWHEAGEAVYYYDQLAAAQQVGCNTLLLHGEKDSLTTDEAIEAFQLCFRKAHLEVIPRAGHFMHIENTALVAEKINEFIRG